MADVRSLIANVYREADVTTARPKAKAPLSARLEVLEGPIQDHWYKVRLPNGEAGFVQKGDVDVHDAAAPRPVRDTSDLVTTGRRLLGVPYLWGGMTPLGVDCSGFVSLVYRVHGRVLLRDADLQFGDPEAEVVERAHLLPGDLLFFGRDARQDHARRHVPGRRPIHQRHDLRDARGARRPAGRRPLGRALPGSASPAVTAARRLRP